MMPDGMTSSLLACATLIARCASGVERESGVCLAERVNNKHAFFSLRQIAGQAFNLADSALVLPARHCQTLMVRRGGGRITAQDITRAGEGGIPTLVATLVKQARDGDSEAKESSAAALCSLSTQNHFEHTELVFEGGAVGPLVQILVSGTSKAQASAAGALHALGHQKPEIQAAIVEAGAVVPLVKLLKSGGSKAQEAAASALASLDGDVSHQKPVIASGCIPPLVAMLNNSSAAAQAFASQALGNAAAYDAIEGQAAIVKAGAVPRLLQLLGVGKAQTPAAGAIAKLCERNRTIQLRVAEAGGIAPLLSLLNCRNKDAQVAAAAALAEVARDNEDTQAAISKAGGIGPLLALLVSRYPSVQSKGALALGELARTNADNQGAIARMGGLKTLVSLLDLDPAKSQEADVQAHAAHALMEISCGNSANQQAVVGHGGSARCRIPTRASSYRTKP